MTAAIAVALAVRYGLVVLFLPFSALDKVFGFEAALGQCREVFKPRPLAVAILLCGLTLEVFASLGVVSGVADRAAALALAFYCVATAILYKRFWTQPNLFSDPQGKARGLLWDFLKNLSLASGFLLIVVGTDGSGLTPFLAHPLASSHPYASHSADPRSPS